MKQNGIVFCNIINLVKYNILTEYLTKNILTDETV